MLERTRLAAKLGAYALLLAGAFVMVLIGQRMPLMLTGLGLFVAALLLRPLRPLSWRPGLRAWLWSRATVVVSPPTYHRLVLKFSEQMDHFPTSQYGQLYARALEIGEQHPLTGRGFDGFRTGCTDAALFPSHHSMAVSPKAAAPAICAATSAQFLCPGAGRGRLSRAGAVHRAGCRLAGAAGARPMAQSAAAARRTVRLDPDPALAARLDQ